ncbi:MAG: hypothetical protein GC160_04195 [Acidobacteria bacterium]|nr:hypothetical protein [Acidobacteriota bacterium]
MFRLMRNIHLGLGLLFVGMALIFGLSSLVIVFRPRLETKPVDSERQVNISAEAAASPRAAARELMAEHGLAGDLRQIQEDGDTVKFRIVRPGETAEVEYSRSNGQATVKLRRQGALETMVQLHTNHGLWHDYVPSNLWAAISLLTSLGLLLLGVSGIYLWFSFHKERVIGGWLLGLGLAFSLVVLVLTRLEQ